jgi:hypothetical protein
MALHNHSLVVYKYRSWNDNKHKACLEKNELYFASPLQINDPFDFKIGIDYSFLDTDDKRNRYIDSLIESSSIRIDPKHPNTLKRKMELLAELQKSPESLQKKFNSINESFANKRYGVISFSQRWNSILMWSHYSNNHTGFCIGYNRDKLEKSNFFEICGNVQYSDEYPKVDPLDEDFFKIAIIQTHTKAADWQYEKEYRLAKIFDENEKRTISVPDDFFEEIILGLNVSDNDKAKIIGICMSRNIPVFKIAKKENSFLLERHRIA